MPIRFLPQFPVKIRIESIEELEDFPRCDKPNVFFTLFSHPLSQPGHEEAVCARVEDETVANLPIGVLLECVANVRIEFDPWRSPYLAIYSLTVDKITIPV